MYENTFPSKRFQHTPAFLQKHISKEEAILGLAVENTKGEDLAIDFAAVHRSKASVITAFEIFEHLLPFNVLRELKGRKIGS